MILIKGENIFLRTPEISDSEKFFEWENDPKNISVNSNKEKLSLTEIESWLQARQHDLLLEKELRLIICDEDGNVAGCVDLFELDENNRNVGVGILIDEICRKKGLAKETLMQLKNYLFGKTTINIIWCNISPANINSIGLFTKCGFKLDESVTEHQNKLNGHLFFQCVKTE